MATDPPMPPNTYRVNHYPDYTTVIVPLGEQVEDGMMERARMERQDRRRQRVRNGSEIRREFLASLDQENNPQDANTQFLQQMMLPDYDLHSQDLDVVVEQPELVEYQNESREDSALESGTEDTESGHESVNMLSNKEIKLDTSGSLPFAKINVSTLNEKEGSAPTPAVTLLDSGASIGICQYDFLKTLPVMPEIRKTRVTASSFTGDPLKIIGKCTLLIDFGIGIPQPIDLYVHQGRGEPKVLLSWSDFGKLGLVLDAERNVAILKGYSFRLHGPNANKEAVISSINQEKCLAVMTARTRDDVTLRRGDEYQLILDLELQENPEYTETIDVGDIFLLETTPKVTESGIILREALCALQKDSTRRQGLHTMAYVEYPENAKYHHVDIKKGMKFGELKPIVTISDNEIVKNMNGPVQVMSAVFTETEAEAETERQKQNKNFHAAKDVLENEGLDQAEEYMKVHPGSERDSIIFYPVPRVLSQSEMAEIEKANEERKKWWTREKIKEEFAVSLGRLSPRHQEDMIDMLQQISPVFAKSNDCLRHHVSTVEFAAKVPDGLSLHVKQRFDGMMPQFINRRMQINMYKRNQLCAAQDEIVATHHFISVRKPNGLNASSPEALNEMTDKEVDKSWRAVMDMSSLTPLCRQPPDNCPNWLQCLMRSSSGLMSLSDLASMYYQIRLHPSARKLFTVRSAIESLQYLQLLVIPQGFALSSSLSSGVVMECVESLNAIEPRLSFPEFMKKLEEIENKKVIVSDSTKLLSLANSTYVDDVKVITPRTAKELERLELTDESYFRKPESEEEAPFLLHLAMLRRVFVALIRRNFLLSYSKTNLMLDSKTASYKYLGIQFDAEVASIPTETRRTIATMAPPRNQRSCMKILGLLNFFGVFLFNLRSRSAFLSNKLRKSSLPYTWTEEDDKKFKELMAYAADAHMEGFCALLDPMKHGKRIYVHTDWSNEVNASSAIVLVKFEDEEGVKTLPAAADSKLLPDTYRGKSSLLGELASLCFSAISLRQILLWTPFIAYTDSLSLVYLLANRFKGTNAYTNDQVKKLLIGLESFNFMARFLPSGSMQKSADIISRYESEKGQPVDRFLASSTALEDYEDLDFLLRSSRQTENQAQFLIRQEKNVEMMMKIEKAKNMNDEDLVKVFAGTVRFPQAAERMVNEVEALDRNEDIDLKCWKENFAFSVKMEEPCEKLVKQGLCVVKRIPAEELDFQEPSEDQDYITSIMPRENVTNLNQSGLDRMRQDSAAIANCKQAREIILNPVEGCFPVGFVRSDREALDYLAEVNYIYMHTTTDDQLIPDTPLFNSFQEVKDNLDFATLSEHIKSQYPHFHGVQERSDTIQTVKQVVLGHLDIQNIKPDTLRRIDPFAKALLDSVESLAVYKDLLFKLKLPLKGEYCYALLVLPQQDAHRFVLRLHVSTHRSVMNLYAMSSCKIWTIGLADICAETVRSCAICSSYFSYQKPIKCPQLNPELQIGSISADIKGPILGKTQKKYILAVCENVTHYHSFSLLKDLSAQEFARVFFHNHIRWFGVPTAICTDLGSNFCSSIAREIYLLLGVGIRFVSTANAKANVSETAVMKFSKTLKAILGGSDVREWEKRLSLVQLVVNSVWRHPGSGRAAIEMFTGNSYANLYSPFVLFESEAEKQMSMLSQDRNALLRSIVAALREKHKAYLSIAVNPDRTVFSLSLKEGSPVYYRVYKHANLVPGLGALLPRYLPGRITKVLSKTCVMIESSVTKKILNRHISDIHPVVTENRFVSTDTGEQGMRKLMQDMNLESTKELESEQAQLDALDETKPALEEMERQVRLERQFEMPKDQSHSESQEPEKTARRSRRLQGLPPEHP